MLDELYYPYGEEKKAFGNHWQDVTIYKYAEKTLVAIYEKEPEWGDGYKVEVYCEAYPTRFYVIKALDSKNSVGDIRKGFIISTGSGMHELAARLAVEISEGMLNVKNL